MSAERHLRIKELFLAACELPEEERGAFLAQACDADAELRREVDELLRHHQIETSATLPGLGGLSTREYSQVGPYRIVSELGRGGMGTVYLAERADDQYQKRVAIKVVQRGLDSEEIVRRFRQERQILASLDHEYIAKLLDGGTAEDGCPYLVMERIEGVAIDAFCSSHALPLEERLQLFRKVCAAVQFAHRNLVIHRDLKPGNILVTETGTPKLLDFGIAKLLHPESELLTVARTATGLLALTPEYASPEQFRGEPLTTATDVYSLGVILYELLTGLSPYVLERRSIPEMARAVCEEQPTKPSTAVGKTLGARESGPDRGPGGEKGRRLARRLRGDLDSIVLMALRKEPELRYASVEQLGEDVRRHLEGLPVIASHGRFSYRAGKFIRRNRLAVAFGAATLALVIGFAVSTALQARRIAAERDRAERALSRAETVNEFMKETMSAASPYQGGREMTVVEALRRAAERAGAALGQEPEVEAAARSTIGATLRELGRYDEAEQELRSALEIRRRLHGEEHEEVAESLHELGRLLHDRGELVEAEAVLRQALALRLELRGEESPEVAASQIALAGVLVDEGELQEAEELQRRSLALRRTLYGEDHPLVAESMNELSLSLYNQARYDEAEPLLRSALAMRRRHFGEQHPLVSWSAYNLAGILIAKGEYQEAENLLRQVLETDRKLFGEDHEYVSRTLHDLATMKSRQGELDAAEDLFRQALAIDLRLHGEEHQSTAATLSGLAVLERQRGDYQEAERLERRALEIFRRQFGDDHPDVGYSLCSLGEVYRQQQDWSQAEVCLSQALLVLRRALTDQHPWTRTCATRLIEVYEAEGKAERAAEIRRLLDAQSGGASGGRGPVLSSNP